MASYTNNKKRKHPDTSAVSVLPSDILINIARKLDWENFHRFSEVCRSWRSISIAIKEYKLQPQPPLLLMLSSSTSGYDRFLNLSQRELCNLELPSEMYDDDCCGSNWGWLIMEGRMGNHFLFNPLTKLQINLPPRAKLPPRDDGLEEDFYSINKAILLTPPTPIAGAISSTVIAIHDGSRLAFCRPGDEMWIAIGLIRNERLEDLIFYNGKLYAISYPRMDLMVAEFVPNPKLTSCNIPPPAIDGIDFNSMHNMEFYLVECLGELLAVMGTLNSSIDSFKIFKLEGQRWINVEDLGDQMLFICWKGSTLSLSASDYPEFRRNCIYFTKDFFDHSRPEISLHLGVFDIKRKQVEYFESNFLQNSKYFPTWFIPNFWLERKEGINGVSDQVHKFSHLIQTAGK